MKKFLFDTNNFDKSRPDEPVKPVFSEEQMALSRAQGKAEGLAEAKAAQEAYIGAGLDKMNALAAQLIAAEDRREIEKCIAAVKLSMATTHKLLPQFAQKYALQEIERVIIESIEVRRDEPRIAVTVPTQHMEALRARIDAMALDKGYAGKMILLADDHLGPSDCRVEWADGGAERLYARLFSQIENEFAKAIAGMSIVLDGQNTEEETKK